MPLGQTPDIMLPEQFFAVPGDLDALLPEQRLMMAVMEDAVFGFQKHVHATRGEGYRLFQEAEAWIFSEDVTWPFAFLNLCDALGVNPVPLREGLIRWRDQQRASVYAGAEPARVRLRRFSGGRPRVVGGRSLLRELHWT
ncbi:MAG: hypothetical protein U0807_14010 [Candidatus Binatia bacterium]